MNRSLSLYLFGLAALLPFTAGAQQVYFFEAEHANYYHVSKCLPNSDIQFYSTRGGGKMLRQATVDEKGEYRITGVDGFAPAFVLNTKQPNSKGIGGNDIVSFFDKKEFTIEDITIKTLNGVTTLTWKAAADPAKAIFFEVLAGDDGINYTSVKHIDASGTENMLGYSYENEGSAASFYKIKVINAQQGERYATGILAAQAGNAKIYPTIVKASVSVALDKQYADARYKLYSADGRLVTSGNLSNTVNEIALGDLASGNYFISVEAAKKRTVAQLQKL